MTDLLPDLPSGVQLVVDAARRLCWALPDVVAVALAGSWARGAGWPGSDVDLVVLTGNPVVMLESEDWFALFDPLAELVRQRDFGAIQERRLRLPSGLVVEVGIGNPSWASTDPVDHGTRRVVSDGILPLCDRLGLLRALVLTVSSDGPTNLPM